MCPPKAYADASIRFTHLPQSTSSLIPALLPLPIQIGGFDLIWDGGPVLRFDKPTSLPTMLGVYNDRDKNQLRVYKVGDGWMRLMSHSP
jgi:hypothetical protein